MTEPFIGEIQILGFSFAPRNWAFAAGQLIPLQQNTALFSLIGITYGGNGTTNFMLPNLAARQACGSGQGPGLSDRQLGEPFGDSTVTITNDTMPAHNHVMNTYPAGTQSIVPDSSSGIGKSGTGNFQSYAAPGASAIMSPMMVQPAGASQPHENTQPYLGLNFSIALAGNFPSFG